MSAPTNGAIIAPPYMVAPQYNMTQMPAMGHQNHFANTWYDSSPTNMSMSFRLPPQQERLAMPIAASEHGIPQTKISNLKTPHPLNTKEIKYNKPTITNPINFTTTIDTLIKAIQQRNNSNDIVRGVLEVKQAVKPERMLSPKYFANLYKNSNKGIKGRSKDRRVSNRGAKSRAAPSPYPVKRVPGPAGLAAYSSKRHTPPEQYMQQHQQPQHHQTPIWISSQVHSPQYDGSTDAYYDCGNDDRSAPY
ncbi:hypothetical protein LY78DRAFT_697750 [Colletotrichum sublineola]|nr:hypothetical protein LY78DRAFT_697750 [Colletotrichum sublineola]